MEEDQAGFDRAWAALEADGEALLGRQTTGFTPLGLRRDVKTTGPLYHGTKADLQVGDLIEPGFTSNYGRGHQANFVYLTEFLDAAVLAAELATGEGRERVYIVEPTGPIDDDPNVTDQKFPGNPTKSYRTQSPLRIVGEAMQWQGHSPTMLNRMRESIDQAKTANIEAID